MVIETSPDAGAALRLYRRMGFEECGSVPDYFGPGVPLLLLSRPLTVLDPLTELDFTHQGA
jgi:ribosomal protein S18 acetylase RimI-like enzyme